MKRRNIKLKKRRRKIVFNVDVAKRRKKRSKPKKRGRDVSSSRLRRAVIGGVVLIFLVVPTSVYWNRFLKAAGFTVKWVKVSNEHALTKGDILKLSNIRIGSNLFAAGLEEIRERIVAHPDIKNVVVSRKVPGGILIKVYERFPVAAVHCERRYVIDEEGFILSLGKGRRNRTLPLLVGVRLSGLQVGARLRNPRVREALEVVKTYRESELCRQIKLVSVDLTDPKNIVLRSNKIREIRLGEENLDERLQLLSYILQQRSYRGLDRPASYIDLRWNNVTEMPLSRSEARSS